MCVLKFNCNCWQFLILKKWRFQRVQTKPYDGGLAVRIKIREHNSFCKDRILLPSPATVLLEPWGYSDSTVCWTQAPNTSISCHTQHLRLLDVHSVRSWLPPLHPHSRQQDLRSSHRPQPLTLTIKTHTFYRCTVNSSASGQSLLPWTRLAANEVWKCYN